MRNTVGRPVQSIGREHRQPFILASSCGGGFGEAEMTIIAPIDHLQACSIGNDVAPAQGPIVFNTDGGQADHVLAVARAARNEFLAVAKCIG
jgi:hypothetical protein